jgi:hypothetical protein
MKDPNENQGADSDESQHPADPEETTSRKFILPEGLTSTEVGRHDSGILSSDEVVEVEPEAPVPEPSADGFDAPREAIDPPEVDASAGLPEPDFGEPLSSAELTSETSEFPVPVVDARANEPAREVFVDEESVVALPNAGGAEMPVAESPVGISPQDRPIDIESKFSRVDLIQGLVAVVGAVVVGYALFYTTTLRKPSTKEIGFIQSEQAIRIRHLGNYDWQSVKGKTVLRKRDIVLVPPGVTAFVQTSKSQPVPLPQDTMLQVGDPTANSLEIVLLEGEHTDDVQVLNPGGESTPNAVASAKTTSPGTPPATSPRSNPAGSPAPDLSETSAGNTGASASAQKTAGEKAPTRNLAKSDTPANAVMPTSPASDPAKGKGDEFPVYFKPFKFSELLSETRPLELRSTELRQRTFERIYGQITLGKVERALVDVDEMRSFSPNRVTDWTVKIVIPVDGQYNLASNRWMQMAWTAVPIPGISYRIEVSKTRDFGKELFYSTKKNYLLLQLDNASKYFWRVRAQLGKEEIVSDIGHFELTPTGGIVSQKDVIRKLATDVGALSFVVATDVKFLHVVKRGPIKEAMCEKRGLASGKYFCRVFKGLDKTPARSYEFSVP